MIQQRIKANKDTACFLPTLRLSVILDDQQTTHYSIYYMATSHNFVLMIFTSSYGSC